MDELSRQSEEFLLELAERLKNPSKQFGLIGSPVPTSDTEKLQKCIDKFKAPLHGAIYHAAVVQLLAKGTPNQVLQDLSSFIGKTPNAGISPYKVANFNYLKNVSDVIKVLLEPDTVECVSFTRIKNLIQNTMKDKKIDLKTLSTQIDAFLSDKPVDFQGESAVLTSDRMKRTYAIILAKTQKDYLAKRAENQAKLNALAQKRRGFGKGRHKTYRKKKAQRKSRKVRRV